MSVNEERYNRPGKRKKLLSLVEIATNKCIQHVGKLQDVGTTPFGLLVPVLRRMNSKQLGQIETLSPQITPESDELWANLVSKEFPDRPAVQNSGKGGQNSKLDVATKGRALRFCDMPAKSLFYRYSDERESFREDSAKRLRSITERLKNEKSANSIVSVPQLLRDPTVRRRRVYGGGGLGYVPSHGPKNSILNKARKETRGRSMMFPNYAQNVKKYDPYEAFASQDSVTIRARPTTQPHRARSAGFPSAMSKSRSPEVPSPLRTTPSASARATSAHNEPHLPSSTAAKRVIGPSHPVSPKPKVEQQGSTLPVSPLKRAADVIRKRRPEPSIFLTGNRHKRPMRTPQHQRAHPKEPTPHSDQPTQPTKKITMVKSSIFN